MNEPRVKSNAIVKTQTKHPTIYWQEKHSQNLLAGQRPRDNLNYQDLYCFQSIVFELLFEEEEDGDHATVNEEKLQPTDDSTW